MKKSYIHFLIPFVALIIFGAVYWNFNTGYEASLAAKAKLVRDAKQVKVDEDNRLRMQAIKDAQLQADKRKTDRELKEAKDKKDKEDRDVSKTALEKARRDVFKQIDQVKRLKKEIDDNKKEILALEEDKKRLAEEISFLNLYVKKTESNYKNLNDVLDKIAAADAAIEAAAKAALVAQKK